ncbi:NACHT, LRR and PYD domains-containing protein 12-like [Solea solea]|uniref:NACHT, LRR and PYD domains-containing protein 12-like n=1 Tax=Solea solea TaxID=90069 RepID=UPI00272CC848|nr:NACHT, LRR and PYD domains-containing protein 12-like [Solea solea]
MATIQNVLLDILSDLRAEEFEKFKHSLRWMNDDYKWSELETASASKIVDLMVQKHTHLVVEVTKKILEKITRNDLVQNLAENRILTLNDLKTAIDVKTMNKTGASPIQSQPVAIPHPLMDISASDDAESTMRETPPDEHIMRYQRTLQSYLGSKCMSIREGLEERPNEQHLDKIFVELFITEGGDIHINEQHENQWNHTQRSRAAGTEKPINPSEIFKRPAEIPIRTVMTAGIAGIGKTILVKKFVLDWAEGRENQDVHLLFPLSFSDLNSLKGKRFTFAELLHERIWETRAIPTEYLEMVFTKLQTSGCRDYNKARYKLLFVLDGFDESHLKLDLNHSKGKFADFDVTQSTSVEVLLTALIKGNLLPAARVWITTRPGAVKQIHTDFLQRMTEVRGFNDPQKEEYFKKKFPDREQASTIILHIKGSPSLFIMCHIPVFCWIISIVLQGFLKNKSKIELPTTLTEMYTVFLKYQITNIEQRQNCGPKKIIQYIESLAKLAFNNLDKGNQFNEKDLKDISFNLHKASLDTGVFTEVFEEVRWISENKEKKYSFVHLSLMEYLAALHVVMSLINDNKNVLSEPNLLDRLDRLLRPCRKISMTEVHSVAIQKALQSPKGELDLLLRFLLGLSLKTNQDLLKPLLNVSKGPSHMNHQETVDLIHKRIGESTSPERSINLFYCLKELKENSLVEDIQHYLRSQTVSSGNLSQLHWSALVFLFLSSGDNLEVFDLKKYCPSEEGLLSLRPVIQASNKSLLSSCKLTENICKALAEALSSQSSRVRELDLSDNELKDSGVLHLCVGLGNPNCSLETLRLSGCMISETGCATLASTLKSKHSNLKELDLSFNHPGNSGKKQLAALQKDPQYKLQTLNLNDCGEQRLRPGIKKYVCNLSLDQNTAHKILKLSDNCTKVTTMKEKQPYNHHPERFDCWLQVLCSTGLTGRSYWEVKWKGKVYIGVTYKGIIRKGQGADICLGANDHSWMLLCEGNGSYSVQHENISACVHPKPSPVSHSVAVYLDFPAGTLSFYKVIFDKLIHLHTFESTFTEPLYPALGFGFGYNYTHFGSSVSLCEVDDIISFSDC